MKLGTRVTAPKQIRRSRAYGGRREWYVPDWDRHQPVTGVYVGWRTYANGKIEGGFQDEPAVFIPDSYFKVALIVTSERKKPVPVIYSTMVAV